MLHLGQSPPKQHNPFFHSTLKAKRSPFTPFHLPHFNQCPFQCLDRCINFHGSDTSLSHLHGLGRSFCYSGPFILMSAQASWSLGLMFCQPLAIPTNPPIFFLFWLPCPPPLWFMWNRGTKTVRIHVHLTTIGACFYVSCGWATHRQFFICKLKGKWHKWFMNFDSICNVLMLSHIDFGRGRWSIYKCEGKSHFLS